jgi:hypothetical protein
MPNMIPVDTNYVFEIERRIFATIADDDFFHRLEALVGLITFHMSAFDCPMCREAFAEQLKQRVPSMLALANDIVRARGDDDDPCSGHPDAR